MLKTLHTGQQKTVISERRQMRRASCDWPCLCLREYTVKQGVRNQAGLGSLCYCKSQKWEFGDNMKPDFVQDWGAEYCSERGFWSSVEWLSSHLKLIKSPMWITTRGQEKESWEGRVCSAHRASNCPVAPNEKLMNEKLHNWWVNRRSILLL